MALIDDLKEEFRKQRAMLTVETDVLKRALEDAGAASIAAKNRQATCRALLSSINFLGDPDFEKACQYGCWGTEIRPDATAIILPAD